MTLHDLVNVALSGEQVPEEAQRLHEDVDVSVGQQPEDLVCSKVVQDGHLEETTNYQSTAMMPYCLSPYCASLHNKMQQ